MPYHEASVRLDSYFVFAEPPVGIRHGDDGQVERTFQCLSGLMPPSICVSQREPCIDDLRILTDLRTPSNGFVASLQNSRLQLISIPLYINLVCLNFQFQVARSR